MEDYNYTFENYSDYYADYYLWSDFSSTLRVTTCIVIAIGFPLTLLAICTLYSQVKDNHVAPIYVINLLVSDLMQMCCFVVWVAAPWEGTVFSVALSVYNIGLLASVGFMVCVALERYLVVGCPLWYRLRRNISVSFRICFVVWAFSFIQFTLEVFVYEIFVLDILQTIYLLLPFPLLIFFLVGTLKALSSNISVPPEEKRRIVGTLVLVLLNYTLLFLPSVIWFLAILSENYDNLISDFYLRLIFIQFSPLVDLVLYVFMRKGALDKLLACLGWCRMREQEQGQITTVSDNTTDMVSSM